MPSAIRAVTVNSYSITRALRAARFYVVTCRAGCAPAPGAAERARACAPLGHAVEELDDAALQRILGADDQQTLVAAQLLN